MSVRGSFTGQPRLRLAARGKSRQDLSHIDSTMNFAVKEPLTYTFRHDTHRLRSLFHRQAGPRRATGGARKTRCRPRPDLHRSRPDRHKPRPGPGLTRRSPPSALGDTLVVPKLDRLARSVPDARDYRRRSRRARGETGARTRPSMIRPTRWAKCFSTSSPPSPSSRLT